MALTEIVINRTPNTKAEIILREQTIGEIRGLERLFNLTNFELVELREKIKLNEDKK